MLLNVPLFFGFKNWIPTCKLYSTIKRLYYTSIIMKWHNYCYCKPLAKCRCRMLGKAKKVPILRCVCLCLCVCVCVWKAAEEPAHSISLHPTMLKVSNPSISAQTVRRHLQNVHRLAFVMKFQTLSAVSVKITVFWDVTPCRFGVCWSVFWPHKLLLIRLVIYRSLKPC